MIQIAGPFFESVDKWIKYGIRGEKCETSDAYYMSCKN